MGQYHLVVNLDKKQYIHPHKLGDGLKLWEQMASGPGGTASALLMLLAVSNGRGGGDVDESELVGSWGGDRIAVVGDYAEPTDLPPPFEADRIYAECAIEGTYRDISEDVRSFLARNLDMTYSGSGWMDRKFNDGSEVGQALKPDVLIVNRGSD